jgi:hypothetical protein
VSVAGREPLLSLTEPPLRQSQDRTSGINAIIGRWPGDESDEVVAKALEELS